MASQRVLACPSVLPGSCPHPVPQFRSLKGRETLQGFFSASSSCSGRRACKLLAHLRKWAACGHAPASVVPATQCGLPSLRLFKLKKRYRNVLDTMFELLPRMARYCPPLSPQVQAV